MLRIPPQPQTVEPKLVLRHLASHFPAAALAAWAVPPLRASFREGERFACSALGNAEKMLRSFQHLLVLLFLASGRTSAGPNVPPAPGKCPILLPAPHVPKAGGVARRAGAQPTRRLLAALPALPNNPPAARRHVRRRRQAANLLCARKAPRRICSTAKIDSSSFHGPLRASLSVLVFFPANRRKASLPSSN